MAAINKTGLAGYYVTADTHIPLGHQHDANGTTIHNVSTLIKLLVSSS